MIGKKREKIRCQMKRIKLHLTSLMTDTDKNINDNNDPLYFLRSVNTSPIQIIIIFNIIIFLYPFFIFFIIFLSFHQMLNTKIQITVNVTTFLR